MTGVQDGLARSVDVTAQQLEATLDVMRPAEFGVQHFANARAAITTAGLTLRAVEDDRQRLLAANAALRHALGTELSNMVTRLTEGRAL